MSTRQKDSYWKVKVVSAQTHMSLHGETSFEVDGLEQCFVSLYSILGHENIQQQPVFISPFVTSHSTHHICDLTSRDEINVDQEVSAIQHLPFSLMILISYLDVRNTPAMRQAANENWSSLLMNVSRWMLNNCNIYLIKYKFRWQHAQWPPTETGSTWWSRKTHWADSAVNACNCHRAARTSSSTPSVCESSNVSRTFGRPMWHRPTTPESQSAETWG